MANEVSICNQALSWLGSKSITSLDQGTPVADLCLANYEPLRDAVLEEARWTFATERYKLLPISNPSIDYGYSQQFLLPPEVLNIIEVTDDAEFRANGVSNLDWRREGEYIVCDVNVVYAKTIIQITDPNKFSSLFIQTLAARIAWDLAPVITESPTKEDQMMRKYMRSLTLATAMDGSQGRSDRIRSRWLTTFAR